MDKLNKEGLLDIIVGHIIKICEKERYDYDKREKVKNIILELLSTVKLPNKLEES